MRLRNQSARTLLYEEVVEKLYRLIDERKIQPGEQLPPERELIEELNVSRNVLREAFHVLESRGVIVPVLIPWLTPLKSPSAPRAAMWCWARSSAHRSSPTMA